MTSAEFAGKWELLESTNFDSYMKAIGVGFVTRKMAAALKPTLLISVDGAHWKISSQSTFKNHDTEFDLGQQFQETTIDGRKMQTTFTFDEGKLTQAQKKINNADKDSTIVRYIENEKLVIEMESEGVKAKRVYGKSK